MDDAEVVILWGSNARAAHPIFFHRVIRAVRRGARLFCVDPRRSESAEWADLWLGIDVGSDIALSNAVAREILTSGLENREFIERSTLNFEEYAQSVEGWTLERGEEITGVPAHAIRSLAHAYAKADRAQLCWTLGITEHHNATDNVLALINLALLCGHVGRYGSGLVPLRGQNNVQGGGDMGAIPNKLPGFQDVESDELRTPFEATWKAPVPPRKGLHLTQMFEAMEDGTLRALYVIGENPAQSEADVKRARHLMEGLEFMVVQDIFLTRTAQMADVVFPAAADWCEAEGTVTSSERRVQRVRPALQPPGEARTDSSIISSLAASMGHGWGMPSAEEVWDELRSLSPMHRGMAYRRLEDHGGLQWPCFDEDHPGELFLHSRLWADPPVGPLAPFFPVEWFPPVDRLTEDYPTPAHHRPPPRLLQHGSAERRHRLPAPDRGNPRHLTRGLLCLGDFGGRRSAGHLSERVDHRPRPRGREPPPRFGLYVCSLSRAGRHQPTDHRGPGIRRVAPRSSRRLPCGWKKHRRRSGSGKQTILTDGPSLYGSTAHRC